MAVDANLLKELKMRVVCRFNEQLLSLQRGHEYKIDKVLSDAIDYIDFLENTDCYDPKYERLINYYYNKLLRPNKNDY